MVQLYKIINGIPGTRYWDLCSSPVVGMREFALHFIAFPGMGFRTGKFIIGQVCQGHTRQSSPDGRVWSRQRRKYIINRRRRQETDLRLLDGFICEANGPVLVAERGMIYN